MLDGVSLWFSLFTNERVEMLLDQIGLYAQIVLNEKYAFDNETHNDIFPPALCLTVNSEGSEFSYKLQYIVGLGFGLVKWPFRPIRSLGYILNWMRIRAQVTNFVINYT